jgi:16S rRNA (guanine527-N7)-methyltransferase
VDKALLVSALERALGRDLPVGASDRFLRYAEELDRFGAKLNLTAIRNDSEVIDKHFADSLLVSRHLQKGSLLDIGAGAGFPGVPLAIVRPDLIVTLAEAEKKKVGFLKSLLATLSLANAKATQARLGPKPSLGLFDVVVARALADLPSWLELARWHVRPGGRVVAMLGQLPDGTAIETAAHSASLVLLSVSTLALPLSNDPRSIAIFERPST